MSITEKQRLALAEKMAARGRYGNGNGNVSTDDVVKRYLAGERVSDIATSYEVVPLTIYRLLRKARDGK